MHGQLDYHKNCYLRVRDRVSLHSGEAVVQCAGVEVEQGVDKMEG